MQLRGQTTTLSSHCFVFPSGYLFYQFDKFWLESKPDNVMAFPRVKAEFQCLIESRELGGESRRITHLMKLQ